jgi:MFS family permease
MQSGLQIGNTQAGALATANLAGYLLFSAIGGALASRIGPRSVVAAGLAVTGGGMLFTGAADSFYSAATWRFVTGLGSGAANVAVMGMLPAWFAPSRRGLASGVAVTGSSFALISLGPLVPILLGYYGTSGWRYCWYYFGGIALVIALIALLLIRNRGETSFSLATPYASGSRPSSHNATSWKLVYHSWPVWHLGLVYIAFGFSYIIFMTFFVKHLMSAGGFSRSEAGNLFMTMGWASLFGSFVWGWISDRIGRKHTLILVYLIHSVSFALFGVSKGAFGFTAAALLYGLTAFSIPAIMAAACGDVLGSRMAPAALGFITVFFGVGQAVGPSIAGLLADMTGTFTPAFLMASGVALLGAIGASTLHPSHRNDMQ